MDIPIKYLFGFVLNHSLPKFWRKKLINIYINKLGVCHTQTIISPRMKHKLTDVSDIQTLPCCIENENLMAKIKNFVIIDIRGFPTRKQKFPAKFFSPQ